MSKKTFERAAERSLRLIAQVKANQPTLFGDVQRLCDEREPLDRHETIDAARARHETRHVEVFDAGTHFRDTEWAPFIAAVIRVHRRRLERDTATGLWNLASETSYHVSNAVFSAHAAGGAIRAHWGIENRHHYPRDVTMGEDACRVRKNPGILARIRSFAANIMRANNVANMPFVSIVSADAAVSWSLAGLVAAAIGGMALLLSFDKIPLAQRHKGPFGALAACRT